MRTGTRTLGARATAAVRRSLPRVGAALFLAVASASCGDMQRQGQGSSYLIINALEGAAGASGTFGGTLLSDVSTVVGDVPTVYADLGRVRFQLAMKDPGSASSPTTPTTANYVTITQYHVRYIRTDGRNTQGVDVPYAFDGAMTLTVSSSEVEGVFTIVRTIAKHEAPLKALTVNGLVVSTIAEVTFYGQDQTGRAVSATGRLSIDFANYGDPAS